MNEPKDKLAALKENFTKASASKRADAFHDLCAELCIQRKSLVEAAKNHHPAFSFDTLAEMEAGLPVEYAKAVALYKVLGLSQNEYPEIYGAKCDIKTASNHEELGTALKHLMRLLDISTRTITDQILLSAETVNKIQRGGKVRPDLLISIVPVLGLVVADMPDFLGLDAVRPKTHPTPIEKKATDELRKEIKHAANMEELRQSLIDYIAALGIRDNTINAETGIGKETLYRLRDGKKFMPASIVAMLPPLGLTVEDLPDFFPVDQNPFLLLPKKLSSNEQIHAIEILKQNLKDATNMEQLGAAISGLIHVKGLSEPEISRQCHVCTETVRRLRNGKNVQASTTRAMLPILQLTEADLPNDYLLGEAGFKIKKALYAQSVKESDIPTSPIDEGRY